MSLNMDFLLLKASLSVTWCAFKTCLNFRNLTSLTCLLHLQVNEIFWVSLFLQEICLSRWQKFNFENWFTTGVLQAYCDWLLIYFTSRLMKYFKYHCFYPSWVQTSSLQTKKRYVSNMYLLCCFSLLVSTIRYFA